MITQEQIQKLIVRQSCLNRAVELHTSEETRANSTISIPLKAIYATTRELEAFVFSVVDEKKEPVKGKSLI